MREFLLTTDLTSSPVFLALCILGGIALVLLIIYLAKRV